MHRLFVPPESLQEAVVVISGDTFHHLSVLRLRAGDEIILLDGCGCLARGVLRQVTRSAAQAEVLARWEEKEELLPLRLLQGLPRGEKFEWLLEKGVEGVATNDDNRLLQRLGRNKEAMHHGRR
jgi:16S rRNA (uracil1498-N3)-methyltransferase